MRYYCFGRGGLLLASQGRIAAEGEPRTTLLLLATAEGAEAAAGAGPALLAATHAAVAEAAEAALLAAAEAGALGAGLAGRLGLRVGHADGASVHLGVVELVQRGGGGGLVGEGDEAKALGAARRAVKDDARVGGLELGKVAGEASVVQAPAQVADIQAAGGRACTPSRRIENGVSK